MKRILVITNNLKQASFRLRIEALIAPLAERGLKLEVALRPRQWLARRRLLRSASGYDGVILQRKLLDRSDAAMLSRSARRVLFDVDDAVMYCQGDAGFISRWRTWRRFGATAKYVDHVVAGNEFLADMFRRAGARASVLPTVVDIDHYTPRIHAETSAPSLVWIGSHSTLAYLEEYLPALDEAARMVKGLKLLIIADRTLPPHQEGISIEHIPWSVAGESEALRRGDIGIAPTPLNQWTIGKCGFKIVQYMAAGLPVIASPVGANAELVVEGQTGFLPAHAGDWPKAIIALAQDDQLRARMGHAGRGRAANQLSLQRAVDFWERLLHE